MAKVITGQSHVLYAPFKPKQTQQQHFLISSQSKLDMWTPPNFQLFPLATKDSKMFSTVTVFSQPCNHCSINSNINVALADVEHVSLKR